MLSRLPVVIPLGLFVGELLPIVAGARSLVSGAEPKPVVSLAVGTVVSEGKVVVSVLGLPSLAPPLQLIKAITTMAINPVFFITYVLYYPVQLFCQRHYQNSYPIKAMA